MSGLLRRWIAVLLVMPVLAGVALVAPVTGAVAAEAGSISGRVTSEADGSPVVGAEVLLGQFDPFLSAWTSTRTAATDADGNYAFTGLAEGDYRLCFLDYGNVHLAECFDDAPSLAAATTIHVAAGANVTGRDAALAVGGVISGRVTADDGGAPAARHGGHGIHR